MPQCPLLSFFCRFHHLPAMSLINDLRSAYPVWSKELRRRNEHFKSMTVMNIRLIMLHSKTADSSVGAYIAWRYKEKWKALGWASWRRCQFMWDLKDEKEPVRRKSSGRISQTGETTCTVTRASKQADGCRRTPVHGVYRVGVLGYWWGLLVRSIHTEDWGFFLGESSWIIRGYKKGK